MPKFNRLISLFLTLAITGVSLNTTARAEDRSSKQQEKIKRVLLISIDGMHNIDLLNFVKSHPSSELAELSGHGITYTRAYTTKPSDSFPGFTGIITGGTPRSTGVYYDDSYDRKLSSPTDTKCAKKGAEIVYDETVDVNSNLLSGGGGSTNFSAIDPNKLPRDGSKGCTPVYPHSFLRVNTIFEVIRNAGGYTAWSDKHPSYDIANGPSGKGVDDLYNPEINNSTNPTSSVQLTENYDDIKVQAILNEIDGKDHTGTTVTKVPTIFGMNFQAVSVGQKLPTAGYTDAAATPSSSLENALEHTDASLGKMVAELKKKKLFNSTLIIITAKHGQSPIDRSKFKDVSPTLIPGIVNSVPGAPNLTAQDTQDDISLLWLTDQKLTNKAVSLLNQNIAQASINKIYAGSELIQLFDDPKQDSRTPDIAVQPNTGVIYTTSKAKIAEHGGFASNDTHVALLLSNPSFNSRTVQENASVTQIAPTILKFLGLNPSALQAVNLEHTQLLPELENQSR